MQCILQRGHLGNKPSSTTLQPAAEGSSELWENWAIFITFRQWTHSTEGKFPFSGDIYHIWVAGLNLNSVCKSSITIAWHRYTHTQAHTGISYSYLSLSFQSSWICENVYAVFSKLFKTHVPWTLPVKWFGFNKIQTLTNKTNLGVFVEKPKLIQNSKFQPLISNFKNILILIFWHWENW